MCWRDDIIMERNCSVCGEKYYGDLGHRGCRGFQNEKIIEDNHKDNQKDK